MPANKFQWYFTSELFLNIPAHSSLLFQILRRHLFCLLHLCLYFTSGNPHFSALLWNANYWFWVNVELKLVNSFVRIHGIIENCIIADLKILATFSLFLPILGFLKSLDSIFFGLENCKNHQNLLGCLHCISIEIGKNFAVKLTQHTHRHKQLS